MLSLIRRTIFSPTEHTPSPAITKETLFPLAPDACNHDCSACPSTSESGYGRQFDRIGVAHGGDLWGLVKAYSTHVIVATGKSDWIRDVEDIPGSLMQALRKRAKEAKNGRMMISASNLPPPQEYYDVEDEKPTDLVLVPRFVVLEGVRPRDAGEVVREVVAKGPTTEEPLRVKEEKREEEEEEEEVRLPEGVTMKEYPHDFLILLCSHAKRDARCGLSAPVLKKEFEKQLASNALYRDHNDSRPGGAKVVFVNHVGGHKYAANVIIYRKADGQGIWLAKVTPRDVEWIVKHTVLEGRIGDKEMIRGGWNRKEGKYSW
jgi:(2Fe-2S) ferredoxin